MTRTCKIAPTTPSDQPGISVYDAALRSHKLITAEERIVAKKDAIQASNNKRGKLYETIELGAFVANIKRDFPDYDELYIPSIYESMYIGEKKTRKIFNAFFSTGKTVNTTIRKFVKKRVNRKNVLFEVNGPTGEGKSYFAQNLGFLYFEMLGEGATFHFDPDDLADGMAMLLEGKSILEAGTLLNVYFTYDFATSSKILQEVMVPRELIIQDESEKMFGDGSVIEMNNLYNAIRTCTRRRKLNFIFCAPNRIPLPEVRAYFNLISVNIEAGRSLALVSVPDARDDKIIKPLGMVVMANRQTEEFIKTYEEKSDEVKKRIQARGGLSKPRSKDTDTMTKAVLAELNALTNDRGKKYYQSSDKAMRAFIRGLPVADGWHDRVIDTVASRVKWELENPAEVTGSREQSTGDQLPLRERKRRYVTQGHVTDEEVIQMELARATDDTKRITFLKNGLNVPRQAIDAYLAGSITRDVLEDLSHAQNDAGRARILDARNLERIGQAMVMFQDDRERLADEIVAAELARASAELARASEAASPAPAVPAIQPGAPFTFDVDASIKRYVESTHDERGAQIFLALQKYSIPVVARQFPNADSGKPLTKNGVRFVENKINGWISNEIGHAYEPYFAADKAKELAGKLARPPRCEGTAGKGQPDVVCELVDGDAIVYSLKARYSATSETQTHEGGDFEAERVEWDRLSAERPGKVIQLVIVYYDHNLGQHVEKAIDNPKRMPSKIRLSRANSVPEVTFLS